MRTITYGGAVSLDGFLAGVDGSMDWLHFSKDVQKIMADYWKTIDTILMGRKTYAVSAGQHRSASASMRTFVFSHSLKTIDEPGVELITTDAIEFVRDLKRGPGRGICLMGGGELARSLLSADLVDEIGLNVHPILLGSGIPAFRDPSHRVKLTLKECRPIDGGCVLLTYKVSGNSQ